MSLFIRLVRQTGYTGETDWLTACTHARRERDLEISLLPADETDRLAACTTTARGSTTTGGTTMATGGTMAAMGGMTMAISSRATGGTTAATGSTTTLKNEDDR